MSRVIVVGAGPVGLFLACLLAQKGAEVEVLEKRAASSVSVRSRSIGVHPPALEALDSLDLADPLVECGVAIRRAHVYDERRYLGALSLEGCPPPYPFVLSLPQSITERLLEERLERLAPGALRRGAKVVSVGVSGGSVEVLLEDGAMVTGDLLAGCDGHRSRVRDALAGPVHGARSGPHYLMADIDETTGLGSDAAICLGRQGVVESFPLPAARRRWVALFGERPAVAEFESLRAMVEERTGWLLPSCDDEVVTAFSAESRLPSRVAGRRWALAGDAAHVLSPIGGQGMNLGLMGVKALVDAGFGGEWRPERYDRDQRRRARVATRRAGLNMSLGSGRIPGLARRPVLKGLLHRSVAGQAARYFTMRGL